MSRLPQLMDRDAPILTISLAAQLTGMHPQTLRTYDRLGLVVPRRARGRGRRYSMNDVARLRLIQRLSQDDGINLPGIRRILQMQSMLEEQAREIERLQDRLDAAEAAHAGPRLFAATGTGEVAMAHRRRAVAALTGR